MLALDEIRMVSPALEKYTQDRLLGEVWKRPGLAPRDRSIVTLAAPIARTQTIEMPYYLNVALDNGVTPREISETITHLAVYSGWPNAMSAITAAKHVFAERKIGSDQLPSASPQLLSGMHRQGYDVQLTLYDERGWRATFYITGMEHSAMSSTAWRPRRGAQSNVRRSLCGWHRPEPELVHFLFPHIRVELLIRTILTRQWDDDAWPLVRGGVPQGADAPEPTA